LSPNLRELLEARVLIGDGAVGTLLGERGFGHPYARANLSPEDAPKYGVEVAQNLLAEAQPLIGGAYIMPPASALDLTGDVLEAIGSPAGR
jgi:hypothetical protein